MTTRTDAIDQLRNEVIAAIDGRADYLDALTVVLPEGLGKEVWRRQVEAMLFDMHLDGVDVVVEGSADHGPWIVKQHIGPAWS